MQKRESSLRPPVRERLLDAGYRLIALNGFNQVGIEAILDQAQSAKASLYDNFGSKAGLAVAVLDERAKLWSRDWLETQIGKRANSPDQQLLVVFDIFDDWFQLKSFEGCMFINVLLESDINSTVGKAAATHLAAIRAMLQGFAEDAGLRDPADFAHVWQMLMKGSIVSAYEGNRDAAQKAKRGAKLMLDGWPRH